jgi:hypothetical protein
LNYKVVITEVTNYGATLYCVAGWDLDQERMIRPEPETANANDESSRFWGSDNAGAGQSLALGNVVTFKGDDPPKSFAYPHATEDRIVSSAFEVVGYMPPQKMANALSHALSKSVASAFQGLVHQQNGKLYVVGGTQGPSLSAVQLNSSQLRLC